MHSEESSNSIYNKVPNAFGRELQNHLEESCKPIPIDYTETTHEITHKTDAQNESFAPGDEHSSSSLSGSQIKKEFKQLRLAYLRKKGGG